MYSILQRHMREYAYMKKIGKKIGLSSLKNVARLCKGGSSSHHRQRQRRKKGNASDEHSIARNDVVGPSSSRTIEQFNTSSYLFKE